MAQWSEAQMATHKDTAKIVWDFCKSKGLSNEVNIRIFMLHTCISNAFTEGILVDYLYIFITFSLLF